jgi:predicted nucleic acid-binding protein
MYTHEPHTKLEKLASVKEKLHSKEDFNYCADEDIQFLLDMLYHAQAKLARLGYAYQDEEYKQKEKE